MKQKTTLVIILAIALIVPMLLVSTIFMPFGIIYRCNVFIDGQGAQTDHLTVDDYIINVVVEWRPDVHSDTLEPNATKWSYYVIVKSGIVENKTVRIGPFGPTQERLVWKTLNEERFDLALNDLEGYDANFEANINMEPVKQEDDPKYDASDTFKIEVWRAWEGQDDKRTLTCMVTVGDSGLDDGDDHDGFDELGDDEGDNGDGLGVLYADSEGFNIKWVLALFVTSCTIVIGAVVYIYILKPR